MKNNKGQALVEFALILPVLFIICFAVIDFGKIYFTKNKVESTLSDVINEYNNGKSEEELLEIVKSTTSNNVKLDITIKEKTVEIKIEEDLDLITPGINKIIGDPYKVISSRRVVANG